MYQKLYKNFASSEKKTGLLILCVNKIVIIIQNPDKYFK